MYHAQWKQKQYGDDAPQRIHPQPWRVDILSRFINKLWTIYRCSAYYIDTVVIYDS
ncbi:hypothetical protein M378DRAFT_172231 [Amanita muscaria Koide BX008]|uniref:Uncharacterized protein n=1 Tax=Amanita muscaria (strain Koide BX008) TaxID=946122 RepID=A0A0C2W766_AMAMK|nr:hypothetical protein M378DRAFT_172231 [Amanita muscaria Koide BX008]